MLFCEGNDVTEPKRSSAGGGMEGSAVASVVLSALLGSPLLLQRLECVSLVLLREGNDVTEPNKSLAGGGDACRGGGCVAAAAFGAAESCAVAAGGGDDTCFTAAAGDGDNICSTVAAGDGNDKCSTVAAGDGDDTCSTVAAVTGDDECPATASCTEADAVSDGDDGRSAACCDGCVNELDSTGGPVNTAKP